ncbi:MAG TPA: hypothetical protein VKU90_06450 [Caulobacteraceae bacterium]|nr:hypothetical protein [Caulobacteraceae bacterium]
MRPSESADEFRRYAADRALGGERALLADWIAAFLAFYAEREAAGLSAEAVSDMLLFQYGCYDWGRGEMFEFDITRQFIVAEREDDDAISQLHLTAYFEPDEELRSVGAANRWCRNRGELPELEKAILASPAFALVRTRPMVRLDVAWEQV